MVESMVIIVTMEIVAVMLLEFYYFIGGQIVANSIQLVTDEQTKNIHEASNQVGLKTDSDIKFHLRHIRCPPIMIS